MALVTVAVFETVVEANLCKMRLEQGSIRAHVADEHLVSLNPVFSMVVGGIKVQVAEEEVRAAREVLTDAGLETPSTTPDKKPAGQHMQPAAPEFVACRRCGYLLSEPSGWLSPQGGLRALFSVLSLLIGVRLEASHTIRCPGCGHTAEEEESEV